MHSTFYERVSNALCTNVTKIHPQMPEIETNILSITLLAIVKVIN